MMSATGEPADARPDAVTLAVAEYHVEESGHQVSYDWILGRHKGQSPMGPCGNSNDVL